MAQLTEKQLEDKLRFAGETIPSMTRRRDGHDYEARQMYLITITVEGRRPLLGRVVGNPEAAEGAAEAPRIELSSLGKTVEQDWMAISHYHPEVKVIALQIMPDHLHSILFVKKRLQHCQTRIDLTGRAIARALTTGLTAFRAKTGAILRAEQAHGEGKQQRIVQLLIQIQLAVHNDNVFVDIVLQLLVRQRTLVGNRTLKLHTEFTAHGIQATGAQSAISERDLQCQAHIACLVGDLSANMGGTGKADTRDLLGNKSTINGNAADLSPEHGAHIQRH